MVNLIAFDTEEELMELTGLSEDELWENGFNLDDWDIGFQSEIKLHTDPTQEDIDDGEYSSESLIADWDLPAHWLMLQMNNYCVGANYVFLDGRHYYTVHHS
jgi:hypothetical protein